MQKIVKTSAVKQSFFGSAPAPSLQKIIQNVNNIPLQLIFSDQSCWQKVVNVYLLWKIFNLSHKWDVRCPELFLLSHDSLSRSQNQPLKAFGSGSNQKQIGSGCDQKL